MGDDVLEDIERQIQEINSKISKLSSQREELYRLKEQIKNQILEDKSTALAQIDWNKKEYSFSSELDLCLKNTFKINSLRPYQLPAMNCTLSGTDCILIMPTGGGKSLCYQLPALISKGVTLVVSPLLSLMEDQIMALEKLNISAKMLSAASTKEDVNWVHNAMVDAKGPLKILYVTPEKLSKSKRFMTKLQKMYEMGRFARLAIDEVHCCSNWGHDFRPDYKFLSIMKRQFPGTPILGVTATATSRVIKDVQKILRIEGCLVLKASFNRPNLFYEVRSKPPVQKEFIDVLSKLLKNNFKNQSGIIYTMTIKDTEELAKDLKNAGIRVAPYHANLDAPIRSKIHRKWVAGEYQAVVATIAFGMGIDKPDVRFVIHHCISKSMENFYQESGRAGRDDKPAKCIVFWRFADLARQSSMVFTENTGLENLYGMIRYCIDSHRCRRKLIAEHFDEAWETQDCNKMCDHCSKTLDVKRIDLMKYGKNILSILAKSSSLDSRLTGTKLVDIWLGKGPTNLRVKEATASDLSRERAETIIAHLLIDGFLKEDFHFTPYSTISYITPGDKAAAGLQPSPLEVSKLSFSLSKDDIVVPDTDISSSKSDKPKKRKHETNDEMKTFKKKPLVIIDSDSD